MKKLVLGAVATASLGLCTACGGPTSGSPLTAGVPQTQAGTAARQFTVQSYPGATPHVIGGQTFYFRSGGGGGGGDGAAG